MKIKLKEISRDDLKVGDTVGIARTVNCGWLSTFRHRKIIPVKITRITPKRTKIETDIYEEHGTTIANQKGWDGTYRGQKMNPAVYVYYYTVELPDKSIKKGFGDLTLIK